ncbi:cbb3-type cytochrome oxidase assembly protein CcoS [Pseudoruegeria sp. SK021]|uniref:cbb3-type cytochrome oxidase assembly protein CcoS n=1 Tax=Pseudoruegeria sp. SK021 TaxID=1933035 RepID=UPI000A3256BF
MDVLRFLIPASLALGGVGLLAFIWTLRGDQYDDPDGDSRRILSGDWDDQPKPKRGEAPATAEAPNVSSNSDPNPKA